MVVTLKRSPTLLLEGPGGNPPETPLIEEGGETRGQFKNEFLILISAPLLTAELSPIEGLSIQKEIDDIVSVLESLPHKLAIEITVEIATTEALLQIFASRFKPLIVHFIGHGMPTDQGIALLLEDAVGRARPFTTQELGSLLRHRTDPPCQLALLNACHSQGFVDGLIDAGVKHVIAVNAEDTVLDLAARAFAKHFYQALFNHYPIIDAFEQSQGAVKVNDELTKIVHPKTWQRGVNLEESLKFHLCPPLSREHQQPLNLQSLDPGRVMVPRWEHTNLPSDDPTFVGRRLELHRIAENLVDESPHRCVALHGMGGMGKTALALAVGRWQHERRRWRDGVWLVRFRNVTTTASAITQIQTTLSLDIISPSPSNLAQALAQSHMLLILDDLDQLLEQDQEELIRLLTELLACRRLGLLVTSRIDLPPEVFHHNQEVQGMDRAATIQAFRNYAPQTAPGGREDATAEHLEALLNFLDGYPRVTRLAAAYMQQTRCSLRMLCEELKIDPCTTLKPISRQENRENSLVATLEISYKVLPPGAQAMFPLLALFPGGLTEECASFIVGRPSLRDLAVLVEFSMAEKPEPSASWRVTLPEPARQYAARKKEGDIDIDEVALKALEYFHGFAQGIHALFTQNESRRAEKLLLEENANLQHFLQWGYEQETNPHGICYSARITARLVTYWQWVIPGEKPMSSLNRALSVAHRNDDLLGQADVQKAMGDIQLSEQGLATAQATYQVAVELYEAASQQLEEPLEVASIHCQMGAIWQICQKLDGAISSYRKAFEIYSSQGNVLEAAQIQLTLGQLQESAQKLDDALAHYEQAKQLYIAQNNQSGVARAAALIAKISSSISLGSLNSFEFKTITVDLQGNVMNQAFHTARYFAEALSEQISLEMIAIPGGEFRMGALEPEGYVREQPQRQVILSSFFLGKYPVTQAQWQIVANLPKLNRDLRLYPAHFRGENRPVESISWYDAVEFCDRLSRATQRRYRLPTEAEWEYACRAGTTTPFHFGATITTDLANYCGIYDTSREWSGSYGRGPKGEYRQETTPVDHFGIANAFGLCDMHGNVWEWCLDHWHHNYQGAPIDGSAWLSDDEDAARVIRGGSWDYFPRYCRSAYRFNNHPVNDSDSFGFRLVCVVPRILP